MSGKMNEQQLIQLMNRAYRNEAPAEIIAAVELEPGLATRGSEVKGQTILHQACGGGHVDLARDLVDRQADVHQRSILGQDALMYASLEGHIPIIEFLLSRGANMTARDKFGNTALGIAAWAGKLPASKFLISRGSDLMAKNNDGKTALDLYETHPGFNPLSPEVKKQRCDELKAAFREARGEMNEEQFEQLLDRAHRNEAPAEILAAVELEPGLVTRADEEIGRTILHAACLGGHIDLVRDLVDRRSDVHQRCTAGQDALMFASQEGHIPVIEFLLSRGANMTARRNDGTTALGLAAICDNLPACKLLISRGSDLMAKMNGRTALDYYGDVVNIDDEEKKERCDELKAAFLEAKLKEIAAKDRKIASQAASIAILKRPARATASMLFSEDFSDLVFVAGGERIPAHRFILAASSEHMGALLKGPWRENVEGQAVEVPMEQSAAAVRVLLRFVYRGEVDEPGLSSPPVLMSVLDLSSRYLLPELKAACERRLARSLSKQSLADALVASHLHDLAALKAACVEFVKKNLATAIMSPSIIKLKTSHPTIWKQLRVSQGLPEEDEEEENEEEEEEEEEQQQAKRARRET